MRLECQYNLEPPTDPSAEAPSWAPAAGSVLLSSVSGLMRLVSERSRDFMKETPAPFSFPSLTDDFEESSKLAQDAVSSPNRASDGLASAAPALSAAAPPGPARSASAAGGSASRELSPDASRQLARTWGSATLAPLYAGAGLRAASPRQAKERFGASEASVTELLVGCREGGDAGVLGSVAARGEGEITETPSKAQETSDKKDPQKDRAMQGVSLQGLFAGMHKRTGYAVEGLLPTASFEVAPEAAEAAGAISGQPEALQEPASAASMEQGPKEHQRTPTGEEAAGKEKPEGGAPSCSPQAPTYPLESLSPAEAPPEQPGEKETAEASSGGRDSSERSTAGCEGSTRDRAKDTDTSASEGGPSAAMHREEPLHAAEPNEATLGDRVHESVKSSGMAKGNAATSDEAAADKRGNSSGIEGSPLPNKFLMRALSMPPLHPRLLQMAAETSAAWGGLDILTALGALPDALLQEEDPGELHEDVLFYEADGHYTETGEEYCMPLGDQQQLVKLVPNNLISVRANRRKFSFLFVPSAGSHLFIELRTSLSLGMSLSATLELVYCGAPLPLYKELPSLYSPTDRKCVLSLDGAGVYAAVGQLVMLRQLEKEVRFLLGDRRLNLASCFDVIVGTGTGGLLALALLRGIQVVRLLREWAGIGGKNLDELAPDWKNAFFMQLVAGMEPKTLRSELVDKFGWRFLNTVSAPLGLITCSNLAQSPPQAFLLRTYEHTSPGKNACRGPLLYAAWATIASPGFLRPIRPEDLTSMGFFVEPPVRLTGATSTDALAANPTLAGLDECARLAHKPLRSFIQSDLQLLVSLGAREFFTTPAARRGPLEPFATEGLTAATMCGHREVLHWLADRLDVYFRFNMPVVGGIRLSPTNPIGLTDLMAVASEYITDEKFFEMKKTAKILAHSVKARMYEKSGGS
ncbi:patatin-like phospholipase domain-containing protein, putative [Eimeria maxima]|uniref:Patatin-like phospholipase domain-containing protein, putative n=1 Tax=Eimeria maxima TaxID=5804 RepID=U6M097_EIMMA|nr:patatin-like phospholipase domain-containing protein, putative [Eimeria maxima]CDJ57632.1 patatin-like phospholipase domain-containing protein, putative [Eimeria maxima]